MITLLLNAASPFRLIKSFGIFNMFVVLFDYLLVISWYAVTVVALATLAKKSCAPGRNFEWSCCCPGGNEEAKERPVRKSTAWMRNKFAPFLYKLRWVLPLLTLGLVGGGVAIVATNFQEGEQQFLPENHPVTQLGEIQTEYFGGWTAVDYKFKTLLMYGLVEDDPITYPKGNNFFINGEDDYNERFVTNYDSSFKFGPAAQQQMVYDCAALYNDTDLVPAQEHYCLLNELQAYDPPSFPHPDEASLRTALEAFYVSPRYAELGQMYRGYASFTGFVGEPDGTDIQALWHSFNTTIPTTLNRGIPGEVRPYYEDWTEAVEPLCVDAACVMTDMQGLWSTMATLAEMRNSALVNIGLALAVSYVVLVLTTWNLLVPLLGVISIGSTIVWTLAVFLLWGYKFNANASLLSVLAIGLAVDYAVHVVHFYNEAAGSRYEKAADALHGVGISVVGGACTTAGAAIPLLFAKNFVFFQMAGCFIFFTAVWGLFFTFFMLTPILMVIGPQGEMGDIRAILRCCPCFKGSSKRAV